VPVVVPGVNVAPTWRCSSTSAGDALAGFILLQSNCTVVGLAVSLKPLADAFGIKRVPLTTMQGCRAPAGRPA
jgi:aspartate-semialdehyde dehydrogenase